MGYQTLPWQQGDSHSFVKLLSLHLPSLKGRSLLDAGCNTGYFCGWAAFEKAARVKGIDRDPKAIALAKNWFPDCSFSCMAWEDLPATRYDVVLCLSAIHYADDQKDLIDLLMSRVAPGGMLVLELGVAPGDGDGYETVQRAIDVRRFPTRKKLHAMLADYAFKHIGPSVQQGGDPVPRYVYHIRHKLPVAALLMDEHYSGKSTVARILLRPDLEYINGDVVYRDILSGEIAVAESLRGLVQPEPGTDILNSAAVTTDICKAGLLPELAAVYASLAVGRDVAVDTYIPAAFHGAMRDAFKEAGFFVVTLSIAQEPDKDWARHYPPRSRYTAYLKYLEKAGLIDEAAYLEANPDVAQAVADGKMPNGQYHYYHFGRREKRKLRK